ncbi:dynein regulatory complex subunit 7 isoform X4 [Strigops habroptila]|uniref:dynein regulatory complex subunit 7 isoform X4 n=1 Tax=Strigops habroptila TaxID=2489341 RepID=UPI0011CFC84F|nr:dynein regulatory complex subunit 7 isoform X4 [Strigops habroptila]
MNDQLEKEAERKGLLPSLAASFWFLRGGRMDALKEKEEDEQRVEEKLKGLAVSDDLQDVETKVPAEQDCVPKHSIDMFQLPPSYKTSSPKEKQLLHIADDFLQQYIHLCPDRKPLFLHPVNECGVEKFVSTTVRPTLLPYTELYDWDGCASFVSDYLVMEPLECPITLPSSLYSPTTTLKHQRGNCFDFSVLLCSMLIGAGYDAYCVQGYATLETCTLDETQELCPLLRKPLETQVPKEEVKKKYRIKPIPDMQSKFKLQQEAKNAAAIEAAQKDKKRDEKEAGKPKLEPLHGLRVHAWVLVLSGKREVPETFFINPFTGNRHNTTDKRFLGIESIWNHRNYWVNMQDCRHGCKDLTFDLGDAIRWEVMLSESNPLQLVPEEEEELFDSDMEREKRVSFDMPPSWVAPIRIPPRDTDVVEVREWFENREDILVRREVNKQTQLTTDYFSEGHSLCLKAHTYTSLEPKTGHTMEFYSEARVDGLHKRVETTSEMTEYFVGRDDFLYLRHVKFGKQGEETQRTVMNSQPIMQIKECFHRNPEKPADEDVAECIFLITEEDIHLRYHLKDKYLTASKKLFHKLPERNSKGHKVFMTPETCITYQAGSFEKGKSLFHLYDLLKELTEKEKRLKEQVRQSEAEVLTILKIRGTEEADIKLSVSIYNRERNEERRQQREAMESTMKDELLGQKEQDLVYLAPFLIRSGCRDKLTKEQALHVRDDCLTDFKHHLTYKVNLIQARLEKAVEELQKNHLWFQENKNQLSTKEKDDYLSSCSESMFHINLLEQRLNREKRTAPQKYLALDDKLRMDPRLAEHLHYT